MNTKVNTTKIINAFIDVLGHVVNKYTIQPDLSQCTMISKEQMYDPDHTVEISDIELINCLKATRLPGTFILSHGFGPPANTALMERVQWMRNNLNNFVEQNLNEENFYLEYIYINEIISFWEKYLSTKTLSGQEIQNQYEFAAVDPDESRSGLNSKEPFTSEASSSPKSKTNKKELLPRFDKRYVNQIFEILKNWFDEDQVEELFKVLDSGKIPANKLIFNGYGKSLLDFFKQLIRGRIVTIGTQKDFEAWICDSFQYLHKDAVIDFKPKYASSIISENSRACVGNRLIKVELSGFEYEIIQLPNINRKQEKKYL